MPSSSDEVSVCAVILSGGLNTRMDGHNKAFLEVGGKPILDRILGTLCPVFDEILLVTRQPELYRQHAVRVVEDIFQSRSSLTGIHAGLVHARAAFAFVVACDAPFLNTALVLRLLGHIEPDLDAVIPVCGSHYQPLCAIYSKRCVGPIEEQLKRSDFKIINLFGGIHLKTIPVEVLQNVDPGLRSFFNVNTPDALKESESIARQMPGGSFKNK